MTPGGSVTAGVTALPYTGVAPADAWTAPQPHVSATAAAVIMASAQTRARPPGPRPPARAFLTSGHAVPPSRRWPREIAVGVSSRCSAQPCLLPGVTG